MKAPREGYVIHMPVLLEELEARAPKLTDEEVRVLELEAFKLAAVVASGDACPAWKARKLERIDALLAKCKAGR